MFQAYRDLRKYSQQTQWGCVRFQIWTWWFDLKRLPRRVHEEWRWRRTMRWAKRHPEEARKRLKVLIEFLEDDT